MEIVLKFKLWYVFRELFRMNFLVGLERQDRYSHIVGLDWYHHSNE